MKLPKILRSLSGSIGSGEKKAANLALASPKSLRSSSHSKGPSRKAGSARGAHALEIQQSGHLDGPSSSTLYRELSDAFSILDADGNGKISPDELGAVLRCLGENPSEEELQKMVQVVDSNGDGQICLQEFIDFHEDKAWPAAASSADLKAAFGVFDRDKNNYISAEELFHVLQELGDDALTVEDCCRMINSVDSDGDGQVNFEEFERMMRSNALVY